MTVRTTISQDQNSLKFAHLLDDNPLQGRNATWIGLIDVIAHPKLAITVVTPGIHFTTISYGHRSCLKM